MTPSLRILHLEDKPDDALLVRDQFAADGLAAEIRHVAGREDFVQALQEGKWDLVLSDYHLPGFNGLEALKLVRQQLPLLPFILMSGTIGEQAAIETLKAGATDYILKQNRDRLPTARPTNASGARRRRRICAGAKSNTACSSRATRTRCGSLTWKNWRFSKSTRRRPSITGSPARSFLR
jgi:CheY-like chemotaxis protein